ncbi:hypothetical protein DIPPA_01631 [Diplonema papillatum]|nr:hypothetical protein DIPPA_01631 [Diplonema papillatum]
MYERQKSVCFARLSLLNACLKGGRCLSDCCAPSKRGCVYYMSGYCNQGSRCPHRHTAAEPPPRKKSRIEVRASRSTQYRTKAETLPGPKAALLRKTECSICLDIMSNPASRPVVRLECKHFFHRACFDEWLGFGDECPMCAAKLFKPL